MDVVQYILGFVARYKNVSRRKCTITTFSTFSPFEMHIFYKMYVAYAKCNYLPDFMS